ncbi:MAG TPA: substrate-binding domain-containing protein [Pirellulales bacterium]|jgi:molybdate-binding protein/DNA-binding XRE family transcriptional regulator|nr:substrate-binding domain-containing protein [Pirellulales bacterium]
MDPDLKNTVRRQRIARGWSQEELARRSGISRAGISAIEIERVVPSAAAALQLAATFQCRVEDLFSLSSGGGLGPAWAWPPAREPCRYWEAEVAGRIFRYPLEANGLGVLPADGTARDGEFFTEAAHEPGRTLVLACCDPAVGLLVHQLAADSGVRLIVIPRSSHAALGLLKQGLVHLAGLHLSSAGSEGNAQVVAAELGAGYRLVHSAVWQAGLALQPGTRIRSPRGAAQARLRWVGREIGSGARQCLNELLGKRAVFRRIAYDHRGVAEAVRCGWADVGVSLRLTSEERGLEFLPVREEAYDLCYAAALEGDPRMAALLQTIRSVRYRRALGELVGYDSAATGTIQAVE